MFLLLCVIAEEIVQNKYCLRQLSYLTQNTHPSHVLLLLLNQSIECLFLFTLLIKNCLFLFSLLDNKFRLFMGSEIVGEYYSELKQLRRKYNFIPYLEIMYSELNAM